jgi:hypothetical protein
MRDGVACADTSTHVHLQSISCLSALSRLVCVGLLTLRTLFLAHLQTKAFSSLHAHSQAAPAHTASVLSPARSRRCARGRVPRGRYLDTSYRCSFVVLFPSSLCLFLSGRHWHSSLSPHKRKTHTHTSKVAVNPTHPHPPSRSPSLRSPPCHPTAILASTVSHPSPRVQLRRYFTHCSWVALLPALSARSNLCRACLTQPCHQLVRPQLTPTHKHTLTKPRTDARTVRASD